MVLTPVDDSVFMTVCEPMLLSVPPTEIDAVSVTVVVTQAVPDPVSL